MTLRIQGIECYYFIRNAPSLGFHSQAVKSQVSGPFLTWRNGGKPQIQIKHWTFQ